MVELRPEIPVATTRRSGEAERFQNGIIRPIVKLQHELVMALVAKEKTFELAVVHAPNKEEYRNRIGIWLQKRPKIKNQLLGVIVGMMTLEELSGYHLHYNEYNKRIIQILVTRIADTLYKVVV
ncbi:hypothetical protein BFP72_16600 [Reichenbachiella sp. 5M10]|nr:hypothetical protein BFP72_16600 [Reichenbachiella sp. 5M10]